MREQFIPENNDLSYYPLLYKALQETRGDIIEMGMGYGSTMLLNQIAKESKRNVFSYDNNAEWHGKFVEHQLGNHTMRFLLDWDEVSELHEKPAVVFIDHAPGERRKVDIEKFKDSAEIIVVHDTEPTGAGDYRVRPVLQNFKYKVEVRAIPDIGAWATAVSNRINIEKWAKEKFGRYSISKYKQK